ncbi:hypothetical protein HN51_043246 [Arachis hypogaea]|nr:uncharacterized protein DS421_18g609200 [Arachis hypogaea]
MEDSMQRYLFFAVTKGTRTGVFTSWEDDREQLRDFTVTNKLVLVFNARLRCIMAEKCATLEMMGGAVDAVCGKKGGSKCGSFCGRPSVSWLPVIPQEELNAEFAIVNSIEDWLVKLCYDSEISAPCFFKQERYLRDQGPFYGFTVVVPGEPYEVELNAKGRFSMVEKAVREDAAMEMLGQVLDITGKEIKDYSYLKVKLLRDSNNALRAKVGQLEDVYEKLKASYEAAVNARIEGQSL